MKTRIHAVAGMVGFVLILAFWASTLLSELVAGPETVAMVKGLVLKGMLVLVPAMAIVGASGMALGGKRQDKLASAKKKRMPIIALNGLIILVPSAFFLESRAAAGQFDTLFYVVQALELIAGFANLSMMGMNIRDGFKMTGRIGQTEAKADHAEAKAAAPEISEREAGPIIVKGISSYIDEAGAEQPAKRVVALCRCGASKHKPLCDGSHSAIGFSSAPSPDRTADEIQVFEGAAVWVHYNRLLCSHAGECAALKAVFDPSREPWIMPDNGTIDGVMAVVAACPSGALSYSFPGKEPAQIVKGAPGIVLEKNGPARVQGIPMLKAHQAQGASPEKYVLCRCGQSKNKPFCDGTHHDIGWKS